MTTTRTLGLAAVPFLLLALGLAPQDARACSPAQCLPTLVSPADKAWIASDVPAFLFLPRLFWSGLEPSFTADNFALEAQDGTPVPFHVEQVDAMVALVLDAPLVGGTWYYLRYPEYCPTYTPLDPPLQLARYFQAGQSPPRGTFEVPDVYPYLHQVETIRVATSNGSCMAEIQADVYRFGVDPSVLGGWEAICRVETLVDGARWALTLPGEPDFSSHPAGDPATTNEGSHRPTVLFSNCGTRGQGDDDGLTPGEHQVEVRYLVHGSTIPIPSATFTVTLGCPDPLPEPTPDAIDNFDLPAIIDVAADTDLTPPDASDPAPDPAPATSSGCQAGLPSPSGASPWASLAAIAFALAILGLRRSMSPEPTGMKQ
jgi:hypothetical protein